VSDGLPTVRYTLRGSPMVWSSCRAETEPLVCSYWILQERSRETGKLVSMSSRTAVDVLVRGYERIDGKMVDAILLDRSREPGPCL
jgi:hypothetical protein